MAEGKVKIRIEGDTVNFDAKMDAVETKASKLDSIFQGIGQAMGQQITTGVTALTSTLIGSIDKASDFNETLAKTGVLFGEENVDGLKAWAETGAASFGQSKQSALDAAATFAVFGKAAGLAGDDLTNFSKTQVELASDLASFHNTSPEEAINAISSALRGEAEPMRKYGVLLDDASLRQEALKMGLISTTKEALTPQQKALAANALILASTKDAQGDFARTSDGLANSQRALSAQWENMQILIGEKLLPVKMALVKFISEQLLPALMGMGDVFKTVSQFIVDHQEIFIGVAVAIVALLIPAVVSYTVSMGAAAAATIAAAAPFIAVGVVIAGLVAGVIWAYKNVDWFRDIVNKMKDGVVAAWNFLSDHVPPVIVAIIGFVIDMGKKLWDFSQDAWKILTSVVGFFWDLQTGIYNAFLKVTGYIVSPFRAAFNAVADLWNSTVGNLSFQIPGWVPGIGGNGFSVPQIPRLAEGGLAFNPMLAVVGDHTTGGAEIITPEKKMAEVVRENSMGITIGTVNLGRGNPAELRRELDFMIRVRSRAA